jgi:HD superfamily phosphodiesterase
LGCWPHSGSKNVKKACKNVVFSLQAHRTARIIVVTGQLKHFQAVLFKTKAMQS